MCNRVELLAGHNSAYHHTGCLCTDSSTSAFRSRNGTSISEVGDAITKSNCRPVGHRWSNLWRDGKKSPRVINWDVSSPEIGSAWWLLTSNSLLQAYSGVYAAEGELYTHQTRLDAEASAKQQIEGTIREQEAAANTLTDDCSALRQVLPNNPT